MCLIGAFGTPPFKHKWKGIPFDRTRTLSPEVSKALVEKAAQLAEVHKLDRMKANLVTAALFMGAAIAIKEK